MTALAIDTFTRADNTTLGANWTLGTSDPGTLDIVSNQAKTHDDHDTSNFWNVFAWPNNQYSQANVTLSGASYTSDDGPGVCLRHAGAARTYYRITYNHLGSANVLISKEVAGSYTNLSSITQAWNNGDLLRMDVVGSTLTARLNGASIGTASDSAVTSGSPGLFYSSETGTTDTTHNAIWDNWEGGDFGAARLVSVMQAVNRAGTY